MVEGSCQSQAVVSSTKVPPNPDNKVWAPVCLNKEHFRDSILVSPEDFGSQVKVFWMSKGQVSAVLISLRKDQLEHTELFQKRLFPFWLLSLPWMIFQVLAKFSAVQ